MIKAFSFLFVAFILLLMFPLMIGLGGGLFGLVIGLIGGLIGVIVGIFGAVIGAIAWIFKTIFHLIFGWHTGFAHHPHWFHFNGCIVTAIIILILVVAFSKRK